ncbi:MAG: ATP-binding cassette domain-containing protein [Saccharofermentans sp.]|nr:ATP-binding cassette domain-containing protein [Saccharofermentans sp.]
MPEDKNSILIDNVSFAYGSGDISETSLALDGVSYSIPRGSYTAVLGANGSGKSTLARLIDVLEIPDNGRIVVFGSDTKDDSLFWDIRRSCALVFQNPDNQIVGTLVEEDTAFGPENMGIPNPELAERVENALKEAGLYDLRDRESASLSGGQKQKLAIAGALAMRPDILILDEATAMLDPISRDEFLDLVEDMRRKKDLTLITITHDMSEAIRCDNIVVLSKGKLAMQGKPHEIFSSGKLGKLGLKQPENYALCYQIAQITGCELKPSDLMSEDSLIKAVIKMIPRMVSAYVPDLDINKPEPSSEVIMKIEGLSMSYDRGATKAISDIDLEVRRGEILAICGRSGCGKTTLITHMNAIFMPQEGDIEIHSKHGVLHTSDKKDKKQIRQTVGLVFQYPEYQLFEETVFKDIAYGLKKAGASAEEIKPAVLEAAQLTGLTEDVLSKSPFELSGGQKRRVALAGVLVMKPEILVLDEPASGLDPRGRDEMFKIISDLKARGTTIVIVSHNMDEAARNADRICAIKDGRIIHTGVPTEFFLSGACEETGLARPVLNVFADKLRNALAREVPNADFGDINFESSIEAANIVRAIRKAVKQDA